MEYFTEQGYSHRETLEKIKIKYGERAKILTQRSIRMGGFMGLFKREGVEMSGYLSASEPLRSRRLNIEEEKQKILTQAKGDTTLQQVLKDVQFIKEKIEAPVQTAKKHENIEKIENLLSENEFSYAYIQMIREKLAKELTLDDLDNFDRVQESVVRMIGESISVFPDSDREPVKPRIVILIGPTGVGKTTTIAKLAAMYSLGTHGRKQKNIRLITIDSYRIGAKKQIETYAEIMGIPFSAVETYDDFRTKLYLFRDVDAILVDTIGKSPKDVVRIAEMQQLLSACGGTAETHLALSATTKSSDIKEISQQFETFKYKSIVLTKLDETMRVGNVISALHDRGKSISYITDGQMVPHDIQPASEMRLLLNLEGFNVDRNVIMRLFPPAFPFDDDDRLPLDSGHAAGGRMTDVKESRVW